MTVRIFKLPLNCVYTFRDYDFAIKHSEKGKVTIYDYVQVYRYDIPSRNDHINLLDEIFEKFNINHPEDYHSTSLSTSDVVMLDDVAYYCDSFGWKELPDWR